MISGLRSLHASTQARGLALAAGLLLGLAVAGRAQSLAPEVAPSTLSADLDGPRALFANPALLGVGTSGGLDISATWHAARFTGYQADVGGKSLHAGLRVDVSPLVPVSELRLGSSFGTSLFGGGYALRFRHERLFGAGRGKGADLGLFARPAGAISLSWALVNAFGSDELGTRHQLYGVALRPLGPRLTVGADLRWDEGGYRTDLWRVGARAILGAGAEASATYQPHRSGQPAEVQVGLTLRTRHTDVRGTFRPVEGGRTAMKTLALSVRSEGLKDAPLLRPRGPVTIDIEGPFSDEASSFSLLGARSSSLLDAVERLRQAAEDPSVTGVLLRVGSVGGGLLGPLTAAGDELRGAVFRLRRAGKPVVAYLPGELLGPSELYLACACDRVVAPRLSSVIGLGVAVEVRRLRGMFEKAGVRWEHSEEGQYKSTFHSYYTDSSSAAQRAELDSLVKLEYGQLVRALSGGRGIPEARVRALADTGALTATEARREGLLDAVGFVETAREELGKACGRAQAGPPPALVRETWLEERWGAPPAVAVVTAEGGIVSGSDSHDAIFGGELLGSRSLSERIERAASLPGVRAVLLRINTGGGSSLGSDRIRETVERVKRERGVKVVVSMGDMAASGGYMISAPADRIYADSMTVTGSIGVVWSVPTFAGLYEKLGAKREVFKQGEHSDVAFGGRELTGEERARLSHLVDETYAQFLEVVAAGRGLSPDKLKAAAQGRIWFGVEGRALGLVDELGGYPEALEGAARLAGLAPGYRVLWVGKSRGSLLERILAGSPGALLGGAREERSDVSGD